MRNIMLGVLLLGTAAASPAHELLDEAVYHVSLLYHGVSDLRPGEAARKYQQQLASLCADRQPDCPTSMAEGLLHDYLQEFGDAHTYYMDPEQYQQVLGVQSGASASRRAFGLITRPAPGELGLVVLEVQEGSPADKAGLRRGDRLLALNGAYLPAPEKQRGARLRAAEQGAEAVRVTLSRPGEARAEVTLQGDLLPLGRLPSLQLRPDNVAVLRIPLFLGNGIGERVHRLVAQARAANAAALVVDLRHNPGGLVTEYLASLAAVMDPPELFITRTPRQHYRYQDGRVLFRIGSAGELPQISLPAAERWSGPLAVLVNDDSASGAEFFALGVQRAGRGVVVGEATAGAANTVTAFVNLSNGGGLAVTTGKAAAPDGLPHPERVRPDLEVEDDLRALSRGQDQVLERAVREVLK